MAPFLGGFFHSSQLGSFLFKARRNTEKEKAAAEKTMAQEFSCWGSWEIGRIATVLPQVPPSFDGYISYILMIPLDISVYPPAVLRFSARLKAVVASSKATEQLNQVSRHASGIKWVDGTSSMGLLKPSDMQLV